MNPELAEIDYWTGYYGQHQAPEMPSQFALFVANELATDGLPPVSVIADIGCGNGRDSAHFAQLGYTVRGLDGSPAAVAECVSRFGSQMPTARFFAGSAEDPASWHALTRGTDGPLLVYARFFIHAIDEAAEAALLAHAARALAEHGGAFACEFRTLEDRDGVRITPHHYRRYIDTDAFLDRLQAAGLRPVWHVAGRGMAKFKDDDAHVARVIALP